MKLISILVTCSISLLVSTSLQSGKGKKGEKEPTSSKIEEKKEDKTLSLIHTNSRSSTGLVRSLQDTSPIEEKEYIPPQASNSNSISSTDPVHKSYIRVQPGINPFEVRSDFKAFAIPINNRNFISAESHDHTHSGNVLNPPVAKQKNKVLREEIRVPIEIATQKARKVKDYIDTIARPPVDKAIGVASEVGFVGSAIYNNAKIKGEEVLPNVLKVHNGDPYNIPHFKVEIPLKISDYLKSLIIAGKDFKNEYYKYIYRKRLFDTSLESINEYLKSNDPRSLDCDITDLYRYFYIFGVAINIELPQSTEDYMSLCTLLENDNGIISQIIREEASNKDNSMAISISLDDYMQSLATEKNKLFADFNRNEDAFERGDLKDLLNPYKGFAKFLMNSHKQLLDYEIYKNYIQSGITTSLERSNSYEERIRLHPELFNSFREQSGIFKYFVKNIINNI